MATRMQQRRGTASQWTIADPVLAAGEIGVESDTAKFKIGDGVNEWSLLDYFSATPDLSGYATEAYADQAEADAISTAASDATTKANTAESNANSYTDTAISNIVDSAPGTLDTLNELAAALDDDANFSATITNSIASKQADVITTAGDLVVGDVNGDASRLAIGTDGQTLAVDNGVITWKDSGSNNFVVEISGSNNTVQLDSTKAAGTYNISLDSGDTSFDIYLVAPDGSAAGYSNSGSITATADFDTVVALGVTSAEIISFSFAGSVNNADGEGDEPGAGAYLESISPSDLPSIDDTATVTGGNFGADTVFTFESGATVLQAKNASIVSGTEALITRPDGLIEDDAPYDLKAVNTGVTPPSSIDFVLTDVVTAGSDPTWVTTSPLNNAFETQGFSQTLQATDSEGTVVDYSVTAGTITPGLSLDSSTGVLSGTPTTFGTFTFTVTATDDGGNTTPRQFTQEVGTAKAVGGVITTDGTDYFHTFTSTDDLVVTSEITNAELFILAGGGAGGFSDSGGRAGGGGGAGGLLETTQTLTIGTITCTVAAGGLAYGANGSNSTVGGFGTAIGGGGGGSPSLEETGENGGSGGGGADGLGGSGTAGQGSDGGDSSQPNTSAGGGGAGGSGQNAPDISSAGDGGIGLQRTAIATQSGVNVDGGYFAGGGGGAAFFGAEFTGAGGLGGGGNGGFRVPDVDPESGTPNTGGGGGGGAEAGAVGEGGSGIIVVRYPV